MNIDSSCSSTVVQGEKQLALVIISCLYTTGQHQTQPSNMSRINSDVAPALDYSQEARDLWGRLGEADRLTG